MRKHFQRLSRVQPESDSPESISPPPPPGPPPLRLTSPAPPPSLSLPPLPPSVPPSLPTSAPHKRKKGKGLKGLFHCQCLKEKPPQNPPKATSKPSRSPFGTLERIALVLCSAVLFGGLYVVVYHNPKSEPCIVDVVLNDVPFRRLDRSNVGVSKTPAKFVIVNGVRYVEETNLCKRYWSIVDGLYFCVSTFWSVGYGDLVPNAPGIQFLVACWIQFLALGLGWFLGQGYSTMVEQSQKVHLEETTAVVEPVPDLGVALQEGSRLSRSIWRVICSLIALFCVLVVGMFAFMLLEGWSFGDALYFCVSSTMAIGYGDVTPKRQSARLFAAAWLTYSFVLLGGVIGNACTARLEYAFRHKRQKIQDQAVSLRRVSELDRGNGVNSGDFLALMLVILQKATWHEIQPVLKHFDELDCQGEGYLTADQLGTLREQTGTQFEWFGGSELQHVRHHCNIQASPAGLQAAQYAY